MNNETGKKIKMDLVISKILVDFNEDEGDEMINEIYDSFECNSDRLF